MAQSLYFFGFKIEAGVADDFRTAIAVSSFITFPDIDKNFGHGIVQKVLSVRSKVKTFEIEVTRPEPFGFAQGKLVEGSWTRATFIKEIISGLYSGN